MQVTEPCRYLYVTLPQAFFTYFPSANQLPGRKSICAQSRTLGANRLEELVKQISVIKI